MRSGVLAIDTTESPQGSVITESPRRRRGSMSSNGSASDTLSIKSKTAGDSFMYSPNNTANKVEGLLSTSKLHDERIEQTLHANYDIIKIKSDSIIANIANQATPVKKPHLELKIDSVAFL